MTSGVDGGKNNKQPQTFVGAVLTETKKKHYTDGQEAGTSGGQGGWGRTTTHHRGIETLHPSGKEMVLRYDELHTSASLLTLQGVGQGISQRGVT